jgi:hypothetical protein
MRDRIMKEEILKWLSKIEEELKSVKATEKKGKEFLENINAYVKDCKYFLEKGDLVLSFESIVWSWAYLEISKELKLIE